MLKLLPRFFSAVMVALMGVTIAYSQVDIRLNTTNGSYPSEMGWQLINQSTNAVIHCWRPYSGTLPNNITLSVPAATYIVRCFDAFGDGWNSGTLTITQSATGVTLWTGTYNGRERQTNVCPGPTVPLVQANQDIARFTVSVP
ncbi:MAG: hypothetical protein FGM33_05330, partial [Candidatus Kapabacteria bacterium]|nr:hypothetical protein [Candidatus Kapabacteria bacterium]